MKQKFQGILFADAETVPKAQHFSELGERDQQVFRDKFKKEIQDHALKVTDISATMGEYGTIEAQMNDFYEGLWQSKAALLAEFCKIVSIGMGYFWPVSKEKPNEFEFRVKSVVHEDEKVVLKAFFDALGTGNFHKICGHNFFDFDGPIIGRRAKINRMALPSILDVSDRKPWEISWIDTMKLWAFGVFNEKISLDRLCYALDVPTPKGEMSGGRVKDLFYGLKPQKDELPFEKIEYDKKEVRFEAIGKYQGGDVVATANVFLRLNNEDVIPESKIVYV